MKRSGLAIMMLLRVVLLRAMMGFPIQSSGYTGEGAGRSVRLRGIGLYGAVSVNGCGIFPAAAGIAWGFTAPRCYTINRRHPARSASLPEGFCKTWGMGGTCRTRTPALAHDTLAKRMKRLPA